MSFHQSLSLLMDFYQLNMAYGCWKANMRDLEGTFHLFFRKNPFGGSFAVACGLEPVIELLKDFHFSESDITFLRSLKGERGEPCFDPHFLAYLKDLRLTCSIEAIEEGTVVFPYQPLLRLQGPIIEGILLETLLMNAVNFPTLIATKAARMCLAADGDPVVEFGLRRAQGVDGGLTASRAAFVGGCQATSNVLAGKLYNIPLIGTHAHTWVLLFNDEQQAFRTFAATTDHRNVFLVDTYNTIQGIKNAIEVGLELKKQGRKLDGVRLDSGDLAELSMQARKMLDDAGFKETRIIASNALDEHLIADLKHQGAKISMWGVGTSLVTGQDQPALDGVYKLSALRQNNEPWSYKIKLSEQLAKVSNPGIMQVRRFFNDKGAIADVIFDEQLGINTPCMAVDPFDSTRRRMLNSTKSEDLLVPIFKEGKLIYNVPPLAQVQQRTFSQLNLFPASIKRFLNPESYFSGMEDTLHKVKLNLIHNLRMGLH